MLCKWPNKQTNSKKPSLFETKTMSDLCMHKHPSHTTFRKFLAKLFACLTTTTTSTTTMAVISFYCQTSFSPSPHVCVCGVSRPEEDVVLEIEALIMCILIQHSVVYICFSIIIFLHHITFYCDVPHLPRTTTKGPGPTSPHLSTYSTDMVVIDSHISDLISSKFVVFCWNTHSIHLLPFAV
jgi:hypothetical protein